MLPWSLSYWKIWLSPCLACQQRLIYVFSVKFRSVHICGVCMIVHIASRLVYIALGLEIPAKGKSTVIGMHITKEMFFVDDRSPW